MQIVEQKIDCQLVAKGQVLDVLLHLVEVRHSDRIMFWNGVALVTTDQIAKFDDMTVDATPCEVRLPDGRTGMLYLTHGRMLGEYFELAGVGKPN
jgi:hypothetical protein